MDEWKREWKRYIVYDMGPTFDCFAVYDQLRHRVLCHAYYYLTAKDLVNRLNHALVYN